MDNISKSFTLFIIFIITISCLTLLTVKPANAQTTASPSVPQFSLSLQGWTNNYYVQVLIRNQLFTPNGSNQLYYNVRLKDHNSGDNDWLISDHNQQAILSDTTGLLVPSFKTPHNDFIAPTGSLVDFQVEAVISNVNGSEN